MNHEKKVVIMFLAVNAALIASVLMTLMNSGIDIGPVLENPV